jgi:Asp-tRNA(Asn)/Glu-tRNA(Gln) amidotransferase A subunit family amidase
MSSFALRHSELQHLTSSRVTGATHVSFFRVWHPLCVKYPADNFAIAHWNLLDYPGVVFPVTTVNPDLDVADAGYEAKNPQDSFVHDMYTSETFADAPVSLQIVGRRQEDEKVLAALVEIERAMGRP